MKTRWIVVANSARACVYSTKDQRVKKPFSVVLQLTHPESRQKRADLVSDRTGHYNTRSPTRGAYEAHIDPKKQEADEFAKLIAEHLEENDKLHAFGDIDLIMPTHFLSMLEKHLSTQVSQKILHVVPKDLTLLPEIKVRQVLHAQAL